LTEYVVDEVSPVKSVPSTVTTHSSSVVSKSTDTDSMTGTLPVKVKVFSQTEHSASSESFKKTTMLAVDPASAFVKSESTLH
jgi:hypothetical protein